MHPALERLAANIFWEPYASDGKVGGVFQPARRMPKSLALDKPVIQINGPRRICYLSFDIDRSNAGLAWEDANVPIPTITVINPKNGHVHVIYEIEPIYLKRTDDTRPGEARPVRYMKAVYKRLQRALGADRGYNGLLVKNPFHRTWNVAYGPSKPYRLSDLVNHLDLADDSDADLEDNPEGRNCTLFDSIRLWAYRHRHDYINWYSFRDDLYAELHRLNQELPSPLGFREVEAIGKSVAGWVWNKYTGSGKNSKRRGIMGLDPRDPLRQRQQQGQAFTTQVRWDRTVSKLRSAVGSLRQSGSSITKVAVARLTGLHRNTVARYWSVAFIEETAPLRGKSSPSLRSGGGFATSGRYPEPTEECTPSSRTATTLKPSFHRVVHTVRNQRSIE